MSSFCSAVFKPSWLGFERQETMFGSGFSPRMSGRSSGAPRPMSSVGKPRRAASYARLLATVVLPTPPDWFHTAMMRIPTGEEPSSRAFHSPCMPDWLLVRIAMTSPKSLAESSTRFISPW